MGSNINITDNDKYEILKSLLTENQKELIFWCERSWKYTCWLIGAFVTLSGVSFFVKNALTLSFVIISLVIVGTVYLIKNYNTYKKRLEIRVRIEKALGFFEKNKYISDEALLPPEIYQKPKPTWKGSGVFIAMIWVVALATLMAIFLKK